MKANPQPEISIDTKDPYVVVDFETRSQVDLTKMGVHKYAAHPTTEVLCLAVRGNTPRAADREISGLTCSDTKLTGVIWYPDKFLSPALEKMLSMWLVTLREIEDLAEDPRIMFHAFNAGFERSLWREVMHKRHGLPDIPVERWRCSQYLANRRMWPGGLDNALTAAKLGRKDMQGHMLMLRMCKPTKEGTWANTFKMEDPETGHKRELHGTEMLARLGAYCLMDVEQEFRLGVACEENILGRKRFEQAVWEVDQKINDRGMQLDIPMIRRLRDIDRDYREALNGVLHRLTDGTITTGTQVARIRGWLEERGCELPNLRRKTVEKALQKKWPAPVRRMLRLRLILSRNTPKKFEMMLNYAGPDGRARDTLQAGGADRTLRWAGRGPQTQNLFSSIFPLPELVRELQPALFAAAEEGTPAAWARLRQEVAEPMDIICSSLRSCIVAGEGKSLMALDYSGIEARMIAWLAQEEHILQAFRDNLDPYIVTASDITGVPYDEITTDQRKIGKVAVLALGFGGGWKALKDMADNYRIGVPEEALAEIELKKSDFRNHDGALLTEEEAYFRRWATPIVWAWRESRPKTVQLWRNLETAFRRAITEKRKPIRSSTKWYKPVGAQGLAVRAFPSLRRHSREDGKLQLCRVPAVAIRLPSGRRLTYSDPQVVQRTQRFLDRRTGKVRLVKSDAVVFDGWKSTINQYGRVFTWGGKLTENAVQSACRDILATGLLRLDRARDEQGEPLFGETVLHVHDEPVQEVPKVRTRAEADDLLRRAGELLCKPIPYLPGLPLKAGGWVGHRYRKD